MKQTVDEVTIRSDERRIVESWPASTICEWASKPLGQARSAEQRCALVAVIEGEPQEVGLPRRSSAYDSWKIQR